MSTKKQFIYVLTNINNKNIFKLIIDFKIMFYIYNLKLI